MSKYSKDGRRLCDQKDCTNPAIWAYTWTRPMVACTGHMAKTIDTSEGLGFDTPAETKRLLTFDEAYKPLDIGTE